MLKEILENKVLGVISTSSRKTAYVTIDLKEVDAAKLEEIRAILQKQNAVKISGSETPTMETWEFYLK